MVDKIINHNNLRHDEEELEAAESLSLSDFPLSPHHGASTLQDHYNPSSSSSSSSSSSDAHELFEFFQGCSSDYSEENTMSHAEDIISHGKLLPINEQLHRTTPPDQTQNHHRRNHQSHPLGCRRSRSHSRSDVKTTSATSLDYRKLKRSSTMRSEPAAATGGSGKKSSPSRRWHVVLFGLVNGPPPEMDIRDLKTRQFRTAKKTAVGCSESGDVFPVSRSFDRRRCSWRVVEFLSCRSVGSVAVTTSLGYMAKV